MIVNIIKSAVSGLIILLILGYLNKRANKKIQPSIGDRFELRLNKLYWHLGIGSLVLGTVMFILCCFTIENKKGWVLALFFLIFFGGLGYICVMWYTNHKLQFDSKRIESTSVYGKKEMLQWDEIISIKFNFLSGQLILKNDRGKKVKAHQHLIGFGELLNSIEQNTQWKIKDLKLPYK